MFKKLHKDTLALSLSVVCYWGLFLILWCILYFFGDTAAGFAETACGILLGLLIYGSLIFLFVVPSAIVISLIVHAVKEKKAKSFFRLFPLSVIVLNAAVTVLEYSMLECFF
ncbi:MAG: hypothetical protein ACI4XE_04580 [Acutalibacteraceae bacterium]